MTSNYILVIEDEKVLRQNFESTRCVDTMKQSRTSKKSIDIFSFSDEKQLMSRNNDFQDDEIEGIQAMVQSMKLNRTKPLGNLKFLSLLEVVFRCLTERVIIAKKQGFRAILDGAQSEIHISKLALSSIAQEKIIPFISQELLKRSKMVFYKQKNEKSTPRVSKSPVRSNSLARISFRFKLKIERIFKRCQIRYAFEAIRQTIQNKIRSLKEIKKVESRGTFNQVVAEKRKTNMLQIKIIFKYIKRLVLFESFQRIKDTYTISKIKIGVNLLKLFQVDRKKLFYEHIKSSKATARVLQKMCKSFDLHIIRIQYKLLIQAFYRLKSNQPQRNQITKGIDKLELLSNTKSIKYLYSSFLKLKDNTKYDFTPMKTSHTNVLFNFSELLETKTRSRIEEQSMFGSDSLTFRKMFPHNYLEQQHPSRGFIEISQCVNFSFSKHQLPLPPSVFALKPKNKKLVERIPDTFLECFPENDD